jgi:hypothetical protein
MKMVQLLVKMSEGHGNEHVWVNPDHIVTISGYAGDYELRLVTGQIYTLPKCGNPSYALREKGIIQ